MELRKHRVAALPPGAIVADRYKVLKVIGMGGFGITYRAWDVEQERQLVVKECFPTGICRRDAATNAIVPRHEALSEAYFGGIEDMIREARTLRSLQHEHIVPVYDVVFGSGCVFCAMQWLSGGSLKDRIRSGAPMSAKESMHHLSCLLSALSYTHSRDVIHRDIKPENIMFDENGQVKLIDFGAALNRSMRTSGITTQGAYSPEYVSPEQFTCKGKIGPWTDFYLLAATWYELLTGNPPESVASRLMQDTLPPLTPEIIRESYPPALLDTLWRNLSLNPSSRCQSADEWNIC